MIEQGVLEERRKSWDEHNGQMLKSLIARQDKEFEAARDPDEMRLLAEKHKQEGRKFFEERYPNLSYPVESIFGFAAIILLFAGTYWAVIRIPVAWEQMPRVFAYPAVRIGVSALTALFGWLFYRFRKDAPKVYAVVELAVATGAAYRSACELSMSHKLDQWGYILALFGSTYVAVRAFDNYNRPKAPSAEKVSEP